MVATTRSTRATGTPGEVTELSQTESSVSTESSCPMSTEPLKTDTEGGPDRHEQKSTESCPTQDLPMIMLEYPPSDAIDSSADPSDRSEIISNDPCEVTSSPEVEEKLNDDIRNVPTPPPHAEAKDDTGSGEQIIFGPPDECNSGIENKPATSHALNVVEEEPGITIPGIGISLTLSRDLGEPLDDPHPFMDIPQCDDIARTDRPVDTSHHSEQTMASPLNVSYQSYRSETSASQCSRKKRALDDQQHPRNLSIDYTMYRTNSNASSVSTIPPHPLRDDALGYNNAHHERRDSGTSNSSSSLSFCRSGPVEKYEKKRMKLCKSNRLSDNSEEERDQYVQETNSFDKTFDYLSILDQRNVIPAKQSGHHRRVSSLSSDDHSSHLHPSTSHHGYKQNPSKPNRFSKRVKNLTIIPPSKLMTQEDETPLHDNTKTRTMFRSNSGHETSTRSKDRSSDSQNHWFNCDSFDEKPSPYDNQHPPLQKRLLPSPRDSRSSHNQKSRNSSSTPQQASSSDEWKRDLRSRSFTPLPHETSDRSPRAHSRNDSSSSMYLACTSSPQGSQASHMSYAFGLPGDIITPQLSWANSTDSWFDNEEPIEDRKHSSEEVIRADPTSSRIHQMFLTDNRTGSDGKMNEMPCNRKMSPPEQRQDMTHASYRHGPKDMRQQRQMMESKSSARPSQSYRHNNNNNSNGNSNNHDDWGNFEKRDASIADPRPHPYHLHDSDFPEEDDHCLENHYGGNNMYPEDHIHPSHSHGYTRNGMPTRPQNQNHHLPPLSSSSHNRMRVSSSSSNNVGAFPRKVTSGSKQGPSDIDGPLEGSNDRLRNIHGNVRRQQPPPNQPAPPSYSSSHPYHGSFHPGQPQNHYPHAHPTCGNPMNSSSMMNGNSFISKYGLPPSSPMGNPNSGNNPGGSGSHNYRQMNKGDPIFRGNPPPYHHPHHPANRGNNRSGNCLPPYAGPNHHQYFPQQQPGNPHGIHPGFYPNQIPSHPNPMFHHHQSPDYIDNGMNILSSHPASPLVSRTCNNFNASNNCPSNMRPEAASNKKCVPLKPPIPSKYQGDYEKMKNTPIPEFASLVNYPLFMTSGKAATVTKEGESKSAPPSTEGTEAARRCVMCGLACTSSKRLPQNTFSTSKEQQLHPDGCRSNSEQPNFSTCPATAIIPTQNKGLCTICDVNVWVIIQTRMEIKWCKGCKNFRSWASFGDKGLATKCVRCRDRQREKYALMKEAKERSKRNADLKSSPQAVE